MYKVIRKLKLKIEKSKLFINERDISSNILIILFVLFSISFMFSINSCSPSNAYHLSSEKLLQIGLRKPKSSSVVINNIKYRISTLDENIFSEDKNEIEIVFEIINESDKNFIIDKKLLSSSSNSPFLILFLRDNQNQLLKKYKLNYHSHLKPTPKEKGNNGLNNKTLILKKNETKEFLLKIKIPKKAIEKYSLFSLKTKLNFLSKVEKRNLLSIFLRKE